MAMADLLKGRARPAVTAARLSQGMTFDQYVSYTGTLTKKITGALIQGGGPCGE